MEAMGQPCWGVCVGGGGQVDTSTAGRYSPHLMNWVHTHVLRRLAARRANMTSPPPKNIHRSGGCHVRYRIVHVTRFRIVHMHTSLTCMLAH
jgi:hypothetical protein